MRSLVEEVDELKRQVARLLSLRGEGDGPRNARPPEIRLAVSRPDPDTSEYPTSGNVFQARFVDADFAEVQGDQPVSKYNRSTDPTIFVCDVNGNIPAQDSLIVVFRRGGHWWRVSATGGLAVVCFTVFADFQTTNATYKGEVVAILGAGVNQEVGDQITIKNMRPDGISGSGTGYVFKGKTGDLGQAFHYDGVYWTNWVICPKSEPVPAASAASSPSPSSSDGGTSSGNPPPSAMGGGGFAGPSF